MRSFIVGTAGHIDHGKSALVRALTGTDPDRLKEERERGITIDLGFVHQPLDEGLTLSFVDVPGHERFVRNMLAGAHGIDAVLLVVAADESVMPQTREHFHICRLLGIPRGIVALTKCDVADDDLQTLAEMEVRELVAGSFLEGVQIVRLSARSGQGLDELRAGLSALAAGSPVRGPEGLLRLPVDRVFTMKGFGTVVTGTLVTGSLKLGDELEVMPSGLRARARGLHVGGRAVEGIEAGHRVAVNVAGLELADLARGDVLTHPGTLLPTSMIDVAVSVLPGPRPLKDQARLRVHLASAEVLGRLRVLGGGEIGPDSSGLAQLRLERPAVAGRGDRLILRSYSPVTTIGGARVLDPLPQKRRARNRRLVDRLAAVEAADPAQAAAVMIADAGTLGVAAATLAARVTMPLSELAGALVAVGGVVPFGQGPAAYLSREAVRDLSRQLEAQLERFHEQQPLKTAMAREELRVRIFAHAPAGAFEHVLDTETRAGTIRTVADGVALASHAVRLSPEEAAAREALLGGARSSGLRGFELSRAAGAAGQDPRLFQRVAHVLQAEGLIKRVGESLLVDGEALVTLADQVRGRWPPGSRLDVAGFKELTGLSRKYVIPLLEYLDRERVTRRSGNDRVVLPSKVS